MIVSRDEAEELLRGLEWAQEAAGREIRRLDRRLSRDGETSGLAREIKDFKHAVAALRRTASKAATALGSTPAAEELAAAMRADGRECEAIGTYITFRRLGRRIFKEV